MYGVLRCKNIQSNPSNPSRASVESDEHRVQARVGGDKLNRWDEVIRQCNQSESDSESEVSTIISKCRSDLSDPLDAESNVWYVGYVYGSFTPGGLN